MKEENLKKLKMALTEHKGLIIDFGDGVTEELYFDEEIQKYRGQAIGIWTMKLLLEIAKEEVENTSLKELGWEIITKNTMMS